MSTKTVSLPWLFHGPHSRHVLIYPDCFTVSTVSQTQPVHVYWSRQQRVFGRLFLSADVQELIYMTSILDPWWPWSWIFKVIFSKSLCSVTSDFAVWRVDSPYIWHKWSLLRGCHEILEALGLQTSNMASTLVRNQMSTCPRWIKFICAIIIC